MFWVWILALNVSGFVFDLFEHHVMAHFGTPKCIPVQSQYLFNLLSCICID